MAQVDENPLFLGESYEDDIESPNFDPVQYINKKFPTESSLNNLDSFLYGIGSQVSALDEEISRAVQAQSRAGEQATRDIADAQISIQELFDKIRDIKSKASQSERMVQEICADIKKLDFAKTHLQSTITSLKRLQMLITAVGQLELMAKEKQFREVANLLDAVKQLLTHFDRYTAVPKVAEIKGRVDSIQSDLKRHVHSLFRELGQLVDFVIPTEPEYNPSSPPPAVSSGIPDDLPNIPNAKSLAEACLVVDALGRSARRDLLEEFVQLQLLPYEKFFSVGKKHASLDQVESRWTWFKRLLLIIDSKFSTIFPAAWKLSHRLTLQFLMRTRIHLTSLLNSANTQTLSAHTDNITNGSIDVNVLLKALQTALRFEQEVKSRFDPGGAGRRDGGFISGDVPVDYNNPENMTAEAIKKRYKDKNDSAADKAGTGSEKLGGSGAGNASKLPFEMRLKRRESDTLFAPSEAAMTVAAQGKNVEAEENALLARLGELDSDMSVSAVFDDYLGPYVLMERRNLENMLIKLGQEESQELASVAPASTSGTKTSESSGGKVYGSSMNMFVYIKTSIKRCTALTTGNAFLALSKEFRTCLLKYADSLRARLPNPVVSQGQHVYKLNPSAEGVLCYVINTGEYCAEVVPQLESMIKSKIQPQLAELVDFSKGEEAFTDVIAQALKVLTTAVMERTDPAFRSMQSLNWSGVTTVGEESAHIHHWHAVLQETLPRIRDNALSPSYFKTFCTHLASDFLQRYLDVVMRQKKISETGTQQLLLDTYNVKTLLLQLPHQGLSLDVSQSSRPAIPPTYMKLVSTRIAHIEMILKLVGTPEEMLLERFQMLYNNGTASDLQAIMSLKGMRKNEQTQLLEAFGLAEASRQQAASASSTSASKNSQKQGIPGGNNSYAPNASGMNPKQQSQWAPPLISSLNMPLQPGLPTSSTIDAVNSMASSMASSVRSLTQDMKSSADSAVGSVLGRTRRT